TANTTTGGVFKRDCIIKLRKSAFGQSAFSIQAAQQWNSTPAHIRALSTFNSVTKELKKWLIVISTFEGVEKGICLFLSDQAM
ncbi:hypothetical protein LDENG_00199740, partial [Lucifuga dentata]